MEKACRILSRRLLSLVFVTAAGLAHAQPTPPTVTTFPVSAVSVTTATLNGTANPLLEPTSGWFQWGTTTNYGNTTTPQYLGSGFGNTNFSQMLTGLLSGFTYHFRAVATNADGTGIGTNRSFTTSTPVFTNINAGLPGIFTGRAVWGDYDNDGQLDVLLCGTTNLTSLPSGVTFQVWRNTGNGFTNINAGLPGVYDASAAWGDYDNDGRLDILLCGLANGVTRITQVWRNTGSGFTNINAGLPGNTFGSLAWADYDNDGRLDILFTGQPNAGAMTQLWRNTGNGFSNVNTALTPMSLGSEAWGDYDNDGWQDILLMGDTGLGVKVSEIWRNTGNGFTNINAGLDGLTLGAAAWGDYNNDGRLDILLAGENASFSAVCNVWANMGNGSFSNINAGLPGLFNASVAWGDYDNDGRLDILMNGSNFAQNVTQVWRNTGTGFTNINTGLTGTSIGSVAWGDYDKDGRLDILFTGQISPTQAVTQIWRNQAAVTNTPPNVPTGLTATPASSASTEIILSWNTASDTQTPTSGITYNLRAGSTPGASDLISPMAASSGFRRLPALGIQQHVVTMRLPGDHPVYWSVQAVDTAFAGSAFAAEQNFRLNSSFISPATGPVPGDTNGDGIVSQTELDVALSNYFLNSPWLYLTNIAGLGGTNVTFALTNSLAGAFSVEYTTNFASWQFLGPATPRYLFTDTNAPALPQRYYRLRWP